MFIYPDIIALLSQVTALAQPKEAQSGLSRRRKKMKKIGKRLINPFWGERHRYDGDDDESDASQNSKFSVKGRFKVFSSGERQFRLTSLRVSKTCRR